MRKNPLFGFISEVQNFWHALQVFTFQSKQLSILIIRQFVFSSQKCMRFQLHIINP